MPNYNTETGIPYGIISLNSLADWFNEDILYWSCPDEDQAYDEYLKDLRNQVIEKVQESTKEVLVAEKLMEEEEDLEKAREFAMNEIEQDWDIYQLQNYLGIDEEYEPPEFGVFPRFKEENNVSMQLSELGGALLVWVLKSPYTGKYSPCSPCIPGAGDLDSPNENGILCYAMPPEWLADAEDDS